MIGPDRVLGDPDQHAPRARDAGRADAGRGQQDAAAGLPGRRRAVPGWHDPADELEARPPSGRQREREAREGPGRARALPALERQAAVDPDFERETAPRRRAVQRDGEGQPARPRHVGHAGPRLAGLERDGGPRLPPPCARVVLLARARLLERSGQPPGLAAAELRQVVDRGRFGNRRPAARQRGAGDDDHHGQAARAGPHPTTKVGTLPPPALTLMTALREPRVTAPTSRPPT